MSIGSTCLGTDQSHALFQPYLLYESLQTSKEYQTCPLVPSKGDPSKKFENSDPIFIERLKGCQWHYAGVYNGDIIDLWTSIKHCMTD